MDTPNYIIAENIISPIGRTAEENFSNIISGSSGIKKITDSQLFPKPVYASKIDRQKARLDFEQLNISSDFTFLESLLIHSISKTLEKVSIPDFKKDTILILSTTKGNIDQLGKQKPRNIYLHELAKSVNNWFGFSQKPIVISNACVSGVSAIILADRLLKMGKCKHAVVAGGDILDEFIISGFSSFMAISDLPCNPYDEKRNGITLGEASGSMFITSQKTNLDVDVKYKIAGVGQSNDANHISGPSRDGNGLAIAIENAIKGAPKIDVINAHGTATKYNDEMESKAFHKMALGDIPLNSLKAYWGHTLGAAGIIETIALCFELKEKMVAGNLGYSKNGLSTALNITAQNRNLDQGKSGLKTISGFGGFNAALLLETCPAN